ncbi:hypothetical protein HY469_04030 [Candidatus Roizmanbacteria bacterium]|nr:hypothetical protein [Candidatus Roizmanbacteria bacterium]
MFVLCLILMANTFLVPDAHAQEPEYIPALGRVDIQVQTAEINTCGPGSATVRPLPPVPPEEEQRSIQSFHSRLFVPLVGVGGPMCVPAQTRDGQIGLKTEDELLATRHEVNRLVLDAIGNVTINNVTYEVNPSRPYTDFVELTQQLGVQSPTKLAGVWQIKTEQQVRVAEDIPPVPLEYVDWLYSERMRLLNRDYRNGGLELTLLPNDTRRKAPNYAYPPASLATLCKHMANILAYDVTYLGSFPVPTVTPTGTLWQSWTAIRDNDYIVDQCGEKMYAWAYIDDELTWRSLREPVQNEITAEIDISSQAVWRENIVLQPQGDPTAQPVMATAHISAVEWGGIIIIAVVIIAAIIIVPELWVIGLVAA